MPLFWLRKYLPLKFNRRQIYFWSGYSPESSLKSICSPRPIADTEGLYHFSMGSYLKNYTTVSISNPCEVATSIMIRWKDGSGNCNEEKTLSNVMLSLIEAILYSVWNFRKWLTWWEFFIKLHKAHWDYTA